MKYQVLAHSILRIFFTFVEASEGKGDIGWSASIYLWRKIVHSLGSAQIFFLLCFGKRMFWQPITWNKITGIVHFLN